MTKPNEARRKFLLGAAVGAGAVAGASLVPDALSQTKEHADHAAAPSSAHAHERHGGLGTFFNPDDAATITAFTERLMPNAPGKPGAREADVLNYIDLALSGAYADQQYFYRCGLASLDAYCHKTYHEPFRTLSAAQQDEVVAALAQGKASEFTWPSAVLFFETLRTHTMEGMFADPVYGGNKDFAGWRLVGFPGAQPEFTAADMESSAPFTRLPIVGLQSQAKS